MLPVNDPILLNGKDLAYSFLGNSGLNDTAGKAGIVNQVLVGSGNSLPVIIGVLVRDLLALLGVIFLMLTIYGGVMWMTAEGKEERIEKAKNIIVNSLIGVVIVLAAYAISVFVISVLGQG